MDKRLCRSRRDRSVAGVCGGIAEYYGWESTRLRLAWVLLVVLGGFGIAPYLILWLVMPEAP